MDGRSLQVGAKDASISEIARPLPLTLKMEDEVGP